MSNGPIYALADSVATLLRFLNLVELFKLVATKITPRNADLPMRLGYLRASVDIFIVMKWAFIIIVLCSGAKSSSLTVLTWYLILSNLYTYFYYHTWSTKALQDRHVDVHRMKRRFLHLILAIWFTLLGFTYLYQFPYASDFAWADGAPTFIQSFWYSLSNSLTAGYSQVQPVSAVGNSVSMIQLIMMFAFLTIIVSSSIPQTTKADGE